MRQAPRVWVALVFGLALAGRADSFTVTSANDSGAGSLRDAIVQANAAPGPHRILFDIGAGGPQTIVLTSALPALVQAITLDGTTQGGGGNTPRIVLNGNFRGFDGLVVSAQGCTVRGLALANIGDNSRGHGLVINAANTTVLGCWFGLDADGSTRRRIRQDAILITEVGGCQVGDGTPAGRNVISGSSDGAGVRIEGQAAIGNILLGNYIGTTAAGTGGTVGNGTAGVAVVGAGGTAITGNVVSGNSAEGLLFSGAATTGSVVSGNLIGLDASGTVKVPNSTGIRIANTAVVTLGGSTPEARNVISGNATFGVVITGAGAIGNIVQGNYIGTDINGTSDLGNGSSNVLLSAGAANTLIGGSTRASGNVISGAGNVSGALASGISLQDAATAHNTVQNNYIGTDARGIAPLGNAANGIVITHAHDNLIQGNVIAANGSTGVVNQGSGVHLAGVDASGNVIRGNTIGTDASGGLVLGNKRSGIHIPYDALLGGAPSEVTIGGPGASDGNLIAFNLGNGITLGGGDALVVNNRIVDNGGLGIDVIAGDNEGDETPLVPGTNMNRPTVLSATVGSLDAEVEVDGLTPGLAHRLYCSLAPASDPRAQFPLPIGVVDFTPGGNVPTVVPVHFLYPAQAGDQFTCYLGRADGRGYCSEISRAYPVGPRPLLPASTSATNTWFSPAGCPVNTRNGELYDLEAVDLALGGPMPLVFSRYYASGIERDGRTGSALGPNRLHTFDWTLRVGADTAEVVDSAGRVIPFARTGGAWVLSGRADVPFQLAENGGMVILGDPRTQRLYSFDPGAAYRLTLIEDGHGNAQTLGYGGDGRLENVADGLGRALFFSYDGNGRLASVSDGTRQVAFTYGGAGIATSTDTLGQTTTYTYDAAGLLTARIRPEGDTPYAQEFSSGRVTRQTARGANTTAIAYGGTTTTTTDPSGQTLVDTYAASGELSAHIDEAGRAITLGSDATGRRNRVTDRLGQTTRLAYHAASGYVASSTDAAGAVTTLTYAGRTLKGIVFYDLAQVDYADGSQVQFVHDAAGNLITTIDAAGRAWTTTYNARGQALIAVNPLGGRVTFSYHPDGTLASRQDSDTGVTTYTYDSLRRLVRITHADGSHLDAVLDDADRPTALTDERGKTCVLTYDRNGRVTRVTDPDGYATQFGYDGLDHVTEVVDRLGAVASCSFDARELLASVTDRNRLTTSFGTDARRRRTGVTDPGGATTSFGYDDEGRLTSVTNPLGQTSTLGRNAVGRATASADALGNLARCERDARQRVTASTDPQGRTTRTTYDVRGLAVSAARDGLGTAVYERDGLGAVTRITDLNGNAWTYDYTAMGRPAAATDPLGRRTAIAYDGRGRPATITHPDGVVETLAYDAASHLVRRSFGSGLDLPYGYDAEGRLSGGAGVELSRDAEGRITNCRQNEVDFGAAYDAGGRLTGLDYAGGLLAVAYIYDAHGRLVRVTGGGGDVTIAYDDAGRPTSIGRGNGVATTCSYDDAGRMVRLRHGSFYDAQFTLNAAGEVTQEVTAAAPLAAELTAAVHRFSHDAAGEISAAGYAYDARGRLVAAPGHSRAWDDASRLVAADGITYGYNGFNDISTRTLSGITTRFFYHYAVGLHPLAAERREGARGFARIYVWTPGGRLLYTVAVGGSPQVSYYHFDRSGSTIALTGADGTVTDAYAYGPYGELLGRTGTSPQPFTYGGQFGVRAEAGLYHMRARWYDADSARFLSRDPLGPRLDDPQSLDPYAYANGNPIAYVDPRGLDNRSAADDARYLGLFFAEVFFGSERSRMTWDDEDTGAVLAPAAPPALPRESAAPGSPPAVLEGTGTPAATFLTRNGTVDAGHCVPWGQSHPCGTTAAYYILDAAGWPPEPEPRTGAALVRSILAERRERFPDWFDREGRPLSPLQKQVNDQARAAAALAPAPTPAWGVSSWAWYALPAAAAAPAAADLDVAPAEYTPREDSGGDPDPL